jgi:hypothetical protein
MNDRSAIPIKMSIGAGAGGSARAVGAGQGCADGASAGCWMIFMSFLHYALCGVSMLDETILAEAANG